MEGIDELTAAVAAVWTDVLRVPDVGADDEFSELCTDVRTASRVVALINQWLETELTLRELFQQKTSARLAAFLYAKEVRVPEGGLPGSGVSTSDEWQRYWDDTYRFSAQRPDGFTTAGWYDRRGLSAMPDSYLREWARATVARLLSLRPKRILEVGCGVGLIMIPMLEHCERYVGTDFSAQAVNRLEGILAAHPMAERAEVRTMEAKDVAGDPRANYDLVLLNSVVQYFPDLEYVREVVAGLSGRLEPGGSVFLGDILNRDLCQAMHVAHVVEQLPDSVPVGRVRSAVRASMADDTSLFLSQHDVRRIAGDLDCHLLVRRGFEPTEMNRFRYDAVLTRHAEANELPFRDMSWFGTVADTLSGVGDEHLVVRSVPDARSHTFVALARAIEESPVDATLSSVRESLPAVAGVEPEAVWEFGHRMGYGVAVAPDREPGFVTIALSRGGDDWVAASLLRQAAGC